MNEEFKTEDNKIKLLIYFVTSYAFLCAILYLWSFWSVFDINFLEYISISDIVKVAIYPIVGASFFLMIGFFGSMFHREVLNRGLKQTSERTARRFKILLYILYFCLVFTNFINIFLVFALHTGVLSMERLEGKPALKNLIPNENLLRGIIFFAVTLPLLSYGFGKINGYEIEKGYKVRYAKTSQFKEFEIFGEQNLVKFIGLGGKHFFFTSLDNSNLYIINSENIKTLELGKASKKNKDASFYKIFNWFKKKSEFKPEEKK